MLGIPIRYLLRHPVHVLGDLAEDPAQSCMTLWDEIVAARERQGAQCAYLAEPAWEEKLHQALGVGWPCAATAEFWTLWPKVIGELESQGIRPGPQSLEHWNDGDAGFVRAIWCMVRHLQPENVVETGVAHGVTSRFVLEALERNGDAGALWSIDLPNLNRNLRRNIGAAVGSRYRDRWELIQGTSRRHLGGLLRQLGRVDLFLHDSLHSERNVRFELERAWAAMKPGGAVLVDDVDANWGFERFTKAHPGHTALVAEAEPLRPDMRRFNQKGLFGVILKQASGASRVERGSSAGTC